MTKKTRTTLTWTLDPEGRLNAVWIMPTQTSLLIALAARFRGQIGRRRAA